MFFKLEFLAFHTFLFLDLHWNTVLDHSTELTQTILKNAIFEILKVAFIA